MSNFLFVSSNAFNLFSSPVASLSVVIVTFPFAILTFFTSSCVDMLELFLKSASDKLFVPFVIVLNFTVSNCGSIFNFHALLWLISHPSIYPSPSGI